LSGNPGQQTPCFVLAGSGYVAGEFLRLLATHPNLAVTGVMSESRAGVAVGDQFPQLQGAFGELAFSSKEALLSALPRGPAALFSAAPHGASAALIAEFVSAAKASGCDISVVDASADFRFDDAGRVRPGLPQVRHLVGVCTYGSPRWYVRLVNDNGRRVVTRALRMSCGFRARPRWYGLYAVDTSTADERAEFLGRVERELAELR